MFLGEQVMGSTAYRKTQAGQRRWRLGACRGSVMFGDREIGSGSSQGWDGRTLVGRLRMPGEDPAPLWIKQV
ncbi:hypothetical protein ACRRTK_018273 [Alexandromys fortis]